MNTGARTRSPARVFAAMLTLAALLAASAAPVLLCVPADDRDPPPSGTMLTLCAAIFGAAVAWRRTAVNDEAMPSVRIGEMRTAPPEARPQPQGLPRRLEAQ